MSAPRLSLSTQLLHFVRNTALPAVPLALWWTLGMVVFSWANLLFRQEIWPNTPAAGTVFGVGLVGSIPLIVGLLGRTASSIKRQLTFWLWRMFWTVVEVGCWIMVALLSAGGAVALAFALG